MGKFDKEKIIRLLLCLLVAIGVWVYVTNLQNPIQTKTLNGIKVTVRNPEYILSQGLIIQPETIENIDIVIEGRYLDLQDFNESNVVAEIDLSGLAMKEGENLVGLKILTDNPYIRILEKRTPAQVAVITKKVVEKEMKIDLISDGELEKGLTLGEFTLSKEKTVVAGTKEIIGNIEKVVGKIDLSNISSSKEHTIVLQCVDKNNNIVSEATIKDKDILVKIPVYTSKEIPISCDIDNTKVSNLELSPNSVIIIGEKAVIDTIHEIKTEPIQLKKIKKGAFSVSAKLKIPTTIQLKGDLGTVIVTGERKE